MLIRERAATAILAGAFLVLGACGRSEAPSTATVTPSAAVEEMKIPDSPYYIIYHPPVDLARQPATGTRR